MKEKELFIRALNTLFNSWGSDAPAEAIWAANDLLKWYEKEFDVTLNITFEEDISNYEEVIDKLRNS